MRICLRIVNRLGRGRLAVNVILKSAFLLPLYRTSLFYSSSLPSSLSLSFFLLFAVIFRYKPGKNSRSSRCYSQFARVLSKVVSIIFFSLPDLVDCLVPFRMNQKHFQEIQKWEAALITHNRSLICIYFFASSWHFDIKSKRRKKSRKSNIVYFFPSFFVCGIFNRQQKNTIFEWDRTIFFLVQAYAVVIQRTRKQ